LNHGETLGSPIEKAHGPGACFTAVVLVRIVGASIAASSGEITFAISLGVTTRAGDLGIGV